MKSNTSKSYQQNQDGGYFVISIDYELNWGVLDRNNKKAYQQNIIRGKDVFIKIIDLFKTNNIKATVATVGILFNKTKEELLSNIPVSLPNYSFENGCPFKGYCKDIGLNENDDPSHFGPSIIEIIKKDNNLEIATHTYGHYYCTDQGHSKESFEADIDMTLKLSRQNGVETKSIVFPRNQINDDYLSICLSKGIHAYRGNEKSWIYRDGFKRKINPIVRGLRILDAYINISGHNTHPIPKKNQNEIINIPSSSFFRPIRSYNSMSSWLKINRIKRAMKYAAQNNEIFHLWWHPHNFGKNETAMLNELNSILDYFTELKNTYGMKSKTMGQMTDISSER